MLLIAVGKGRPGPERDLFERYNARIRPGLLLRELADGTGSAAEAKSREAAAMLAAIPAGTRVVALDKSGAAWSSEALARRLETWRDAGQSVAFLIGGVEGLASSVLVRADETLSLGPMTWPHLLVRALLAEQLYRAQSILARHPYHRSG